MDIDVAKIKKIIETGKRLTTSEGFKIARDEWSKGHKVNMIIKVSNNVIQEWYRHSNQLVSIDDEATYITDNDNKAFKSMAGYSIFATSLGTLEKAAKGVQLPPSCSYERIEHFPMDWIIIYE
jgi:hypothetical protein